jgi:hypothetical protein
MSWGIDIELPDGEWVEIVEGHTYNLSPMWRLAGVFEDGSHDLDGMLAADLADRAARGLLRAVRYPTMFEEVNPSNGWGDFDGFVEILTRTAIRCAENPTGIVRWNG